VVGDGVVPTAAAVVAIDAVFNPNIQMTIKTALV